MSESTEYSYTQGVTLGGVELLQAVGVTAVAAGAVAGAAIALSVGRYVDNFRRQVIQHQQAGIPDSQLMSQLLDDHPLLAEAASKEMGVDKESLLAGGLEQFTQRVDRGAKRLALAETTLLSSHLSFAVEELGYTIKAPRRTKRQGLVMRATRDDGTALALEVDARNGRLSLDLSGFRDGRCLEVRHQLEQNLRKRGVYLSTNLSQRHDASTGGALTRKVNEVFGEAGAVRGQITRFLQPGQSGKQ